MCSQELRLEINQDVDKVIKLRQKGKCVTPAGENSADGICVSFRTHDDIIRRRRRNQSRLLAPDSFYPDEKHCIINVCSRRSKASLTSKCAAASSNAQHTMNSFHSNSSESVRRCHSPLLSSWDLSYYRRVFCWCYGHRWALLSLKPCSLHVVWNILALCGYLGLFVHMVDDVQSIKWNEDFRRSNRFLILYKKTTISLK